MTSFWKELNWLSESGGGGSEGCEGEIHWGHWPLRPVGWF